MDANPNILLIRFKSNADFADSLWFNTAGF